MAQRWQHQPADARGLPRCRGTIRDAHSEAQPSYAASVANRYAVREPSPPP